MTISKTATAGLGLFLATSLTSLTAVSQPACTPRSQALATLSVTYDEHPLLVGHNGGDIIEVFSATNGETFTVIVTSRVGNMLCTRMVADGKDLRPMPFSVGQGS